MALITDPDSLNQGDINNVSDLAFTASSGINTTLTGAATLPALADDEFFAIRDSSTLGNNGIYRVNDASPSTSAVICEKVSGPNPVDLSAEDTNVFGTTGASSEMSVHFDTSLEEITLLEAGNLGTDGVTMLALHSFIKEEWKTDQLLIDSGSFPMVGISSAAGQWEFGVDPSGNNSDWALKDNATFTVDSRRLIRNSGWTEIDNAGVIQAKYFNVTTLGTFEDVADQAYYFFGDSLTVDNSVDFAFSGPVNEAVRFFNNVTPADTGAPGFVFTGTNTLTRNDGGDWIAEGYVEGGQITIANAEDSGNNATFLIATITATVITSTGFTDNADDSTMTASVDNDNLFTTNLRIRDADPEGKSFGTADLAAGGETLITAKVIKLPLANVTDLKITKTDPVTGAPYDEIRLRYLPATYNREVDSSSKRNFGVICDVGTYSRENGVSATSTLFTSIDFQLGVGEALADYAGGDLIIHEGTDQATHTISGTPVDNAGVLEITLTGALTDSETVLSFTMERSTPLTATAAQIYEKIQSQLRQATDIDELGTVVIGKMAGELCTFVGDDLDFGKQQSVNPNGGGVGMIVEGFDANDTNNLFFTDNGNVRRNFPFVAAGNLLFNSNLVNDAAGEFWLYYQYTTRTTNSDIDTSNASGDTHDLTGTLPNMAVNDYIEISGFVQAANNGLFIITVENTPSADYTIRRVDGENVGTAETDQTVNVDENPIDSPDAIIVDDNASADIVGNTTTASIAFDFDYDNNVQGGRTAASDAAVVLKAVGLITAQYASVTGLTITRNTGLSFSITAALERNFSNP